MKGTSFTTLRHFPAILVGSTLAVMLASLVVAIYPLVLSATASSLLREKVESSSITRYGMGITYQSLPLEFGHSKGAAKEASEPLDGAFAEVSSRIPSLDPPIRSILAPVTDVARTGSAEARSGRLFGGTGAADTVQLVAGSRGPGALIPDAIATPLGIGPGDSLSVEGQGSNTIDVPVSGVYRALSTQPRTGYWLAWDREIYPLCPTCSAPPPFIIVPRGSILEAMSVLRIDSASFGWQAPLAAGVLLTQQDANDLAASVGRIESEVTDDTSQLGKLFDCCQVLSADGFRHERRFRSSAGQVASEVDDRVASLGTPSALVAALAALVALGLIVALGVASTRARAEELAVLDARGVRPLTVGMHRLMESLAPALSGAAAGVCLATVMVHLLFDDAPIARDAYVSSSVRAAIFAGLAVVLLAGIPVASYLRRRGARRPHHALSRIPWELATGTVAVFSLRDVQANGAFRHLSGSVDTPRPELLWFLLMAILTAAIIAGRVAALVFRSLRSHSGSFRPAWYLASHRLAGPTRSSAAFVVGAALCLGLLFGSAALSTSLAATVDAKSRLFVGGDAQVRVDYPSTRPSGILSRTTQTTRVSGGVGLPDGTRADLVAVDPATFREAAYWNDRFSETPLTTILQGLSAAPSDAIPIVVVGGVQAPLGIEVGGVKLDVQVVARATAFPTSSSETPLVVVDTRRLIDELGGPGVLETPQATTSWILGGSPDEVRHDITLFGEAAGTVLTAAQVGDLPQIQAILDTFAVIRLVSFGSLVLLLIALFFHLQARERAEVVGFGLSIRMGMSTKSHRHSLVIEVGSCLATALIVASAPALFAASTAIPLLDPLANIRPAPIILIPGLLMLACVPLLAGASWLSAAATTARLRGTPLGEAMRTGE
jgi:FtsX-like permease family